MSSTGVPKGRPDTEVSQQADAFPDAAAAGRGGEGPLPIRAEITLMRREIDALKHEAEKKSGAPWYRQASVIIAFIALLFSVAATFYAEQRSHERDDAAARVELSQLIQRLSALPKENAELWAQYGDDASVAYEISSVVQAEQMTLAEQAADVIERIPDTATATEYYQVAKNLAEAGAPERAASLFEAGLRRKSDLVTRSSILRGQANLYADLGEIERARGAIKRAIELYASEPPAARAGGIAYNEYIWAGLEADSGNCDRALAHAGNADEQVQKIPASDREGLLPMPLLRLAAKHLADTCGHVPRG